MTQDTISIYELSVKKMKEMANRNGYIVISTEEKNRQYVKKTIYELELTFGSRKPSKFIENFYGFKLLWKFIISTFTRAKIYELSVFYIHYQPSSYINDEGDIVLK
ncbi:MAG: hypothetical protein ACRBEE_05045 [Arenicella sp.]